MTLTEIYSALLQRFKYEAFLYARKEIGLRKRRRQVQFFDDLLGGVYRALKGPGGMILAENIRGKYRAALIDEFQDTDPLQYEIFRRIYEGSEGLLYLIGDPKQAIYSFRGADIYAYLKARREVDDIFSLEKNWRSDRGLVEGVNALFLNRDKPFLFEEIRYRRAVK